jgi:hypothetical protein
MKKELNLEKIPLKTRKKLFFKKCETKQELAKFIQVFFGLYLPDVTVSRYADTNPLDIIWEVYNICVNKSNPDNIEELLYVAGRGSGKTLGMAIAELLVMLHDERDVCHVGAVIAQAKRCYEYQTNFMLSSKIRPILEDKTLSQEERVLQKLNMEKSAFLLSGKTVTLEVLPCTLKACTDPESIISLYNGNKIKAKDIKIGDSLVTLSKDNAITEKVKVIRADLINKPCYKVNLSDGSVIIAASNHKLLTKNGWLAVEDIKPNIKLLRFDSHYDYSENYELSFNFDDRFARSAIIGMLLGDASLSFKVKEDKFIGNPRLYIGHSIKQYEYLKYCVNSISSLVRTKQIRDKKSGFGAKIKEAITESSKNLLFARSLFYGFSGSKKKRVPHNISDLLDPCSLAFWFMDDGSNGENATFATHGFEIHEVDTLVLALRDKFDLQGASRKLDNCNRPFISLDVKSTKKLYKLIASYIHDTMSYKVQNQSVLNSYRLSDGKKVKYSKNGIPKEDTDTRPYRTWLRQFKDLPHASVISTEYVGIHPTVEIETDASSYTQKSYICNGFVSHNCNGPHVPLVVTDEIDTVSGEGLKAFKEISGMLDTKGDKKALRVGISTRKSRYGLMNRMMEDADIAGRHVRRWTAWEFTERCPDERSGTVPTVSYHIQDNMEVVDEATFKMKDPKKQKEYVTHTMPGEKCLQCPAAAICLGDAKNQTSKSWMLKPVGELIKKVRSEGTDWALAQLMNLKPSVEGIIYKEFEEKIHVKDWNSMWKTLTGLDFPGECSHDLFVKKCHSMNLPCYAGVDWGWSNPNTVVYFFIDKRDNVYVVRSDGMTYVSQPEWIHYIKTKYNHMYRCQLYFPDVADQGAVTEMKKAGLPVSAENDKSINVGIQVIKKLLRVPGTADTKMHVAKETNEPLITEFLTYHFKTSADGTITEMPDTEYDHWLDALRYPLTMLLGKGTLVMGQMIEVDKSSTVDSHGNYYRTPSPEEFCTVNNIRINTEEPDLAKLGKIGRLNDIHDDEDPGSSGGFLWGF